MEKLYLFYLQVFREKLFALCCLAGRGRGESAADDFFVPEEQLIPYYRQDGLNYRHRRLLTTKF